MTQADDRVGGRPTQGDAGRADDDGQRGEAVGAGVQPVGDQGGGTDTTADPDAVERDEFVAGESDHTGGGDPTEMLDGCRVEQPVDRLPPGDDRGERDHRDDEQPGEVFGPPEPVGIATGRGPPGQRERDPQRNGREGVGEVVHGVGEQRHRAADRDDARTAAAR